MQLTLCRVCEEYEGSRRERSKSVGYLSVISCSQAIVDDAMCPVMVPSDTSNFQICPKGIMRKIRIGARQDRSISKRSIFGGRVRNIPEDDLHGWTMIPKEEMPLEHDEVPVYVVLRAFGVNGLPIDAEIQVLFAEKCAPRAALGGCTGKPLTARQQQCLHTAYARRTYNNQWGNGSALKVRKDGAVAGQVAVQVASANISSSGRGSA